MSLVLSIDCYSIVTGIVHRLLQYCHWYCPYIVTLLSPYRTSLTALMKARAAELEVKLLLFAIQKTTAFEKMIAQKFADSKYVASVSVCVCCVCVCEQCYFVICTAQCIEHLCLLYFLQLSHTSSPKTQKKMNPTDNEVVYELRPHTHTHTHTHTLTHTHTHTPTHTHTHTHTQSDDDSPKRKQPDSPFQGMISRCFEPHLNIYITSQDRWVVLTCSVIN